MNQSPPEKRDHAHDRTRDARESALSYPGHYLPTEAGPTIAFSCSEMHHRGQLMLIERMLGIVPHLTRHMQERMATASSVPAR